MKKFCQLKALTLALFLVLGTVVTLDAVTYERLPNNSPHRGFYYYLSMAEYQDLLIPTMPPEIMVGYSVADSLVRSIPSFKSLPGLVGQLDLQSDTAAYLFKYWLILNDYDPLRFHSFFKRDLPDAKVTGGAVQGALYMQMYKDTKLNYLYPSYILHIYVNDVLRIDTANTSIRIRIRSMGTVCDTIVNVKSETIVYCKVLDTLKGKQFPSLNDAIFYNGELPDSGSSIVANIPPQTDIVFSYKDSWQSWNSELYPLDWIKPGNEYIVFLEINGRDNLKNLDGSINKHYYSIAPFSKYGFRGIYQIENGMVKDADNVLEFGKKNSVNIFKQNIINKLEEIKNYGE